jgi:phenylalanyl-tRNA synthetase alpha chain
VSSPHDPLAEISRLREAALRDIAAAADPDALAEARVRHLARKAPLPGMMRGLGALPPDLRARVGQAANEARGAVETALAEREAALGTGGGETRPDPTFPGLKPPRGGLHPVSATERRILAIFRGMGFATARGREVEDDYHNFEALNIPKGHAARDAQDTFFASENILLRTHTSPGQIRVMKSTPPPVRMVFPGRVFRNESEDATHASEFHQVEVLYVDRGVTMKDLKGTLTAFAHELFGGHLAVRFRPSYFPFVEPGAEMDIECFQCRGAGCRLCKDSGWIEVLGSGMVHTQVLREVGYDPEEVSGYAAGIGVERIALLRHGITDIRLFLENDLRFLSQFA